MKEDGSQVYWEKDGRSLAASPLSRYNFKHGWWERGGGTSQKEREEKQGIIFKKVIPNQNRFKILLPNL